MKYEISVTHQFEKDLKLARKQGKNEDRLWEVVGKLANGETLDKKYKDHNLTGKYSGYRECHIYPDWLLVYKQEDNILVLLLYRLGSHSDLF